MGLVLEGNDVATGEIRNMSEPPIDFLICTACDHRITLKPESAYAVLLTERDALKAQIRERDETISENVPELALGEALQRAVHGLPVSDFYASVGVIGIAQDTRSERDNLKAQNELLKAAADIADAIIEDSDATRTIWDLKAQNAESEAAMRSLVDGLPLGYTGSGTETAGDIAAKVLTKFAELKAQNAALEARIEAMKAEPNRQTILRQAAELERLRDLIVRADRDTDNLMLIESEAEEIRAAREGGKA